MLDIPDPHDREPMDSDRAMGDMETDAVKRGFGIPIHEGETLESSDQTVFLAEDHAIETGQSGQKVGEFRQPIPVFRRGFAG